MTERALSTIRQDGTAAALDKCGKLADHLAAKLLELQIEHFHEASEVQELRVFLERAAAVLKKL
jgi:hypothetical protein